MARGFDGVYPDIVDGFEIFEQVGKDYVDDRVNPETEQSYRRDMVVWVKAIAARARARHPTERFAAPRLCGFPRNDQRHRHRIPLHKR
ncbi:MAG: hypothetical protein WCK55_04740 [Verrucomicrobiota bacterium]